MHAITVSNQRGHEFERTWRGKYGRVWKKEKKGRSVEIKNLFGNVFESCHLKVVKKI